MDYNRITDNITNLHKLKISKNENHSLIEELANLKSENKNILRLYEELSSKINKNEKKIVTLENKATENQDIRGQVTTFAFRLLEQNLKTHILKSQSLDQEISNLKNNNNIIIPRLDNLEEEIKILKSELNKPCIDSDKFNELNLNDKSEINLYGLVLDDKTFEFQILSKPIELYSTLKNYKCIFSMNNFDDKIEFNIEHMLPGFSLIKSVESLINSLLSDGNCNCNGSEKFYTIFISETKIEFLKRYGKNLKKRLSFYFYKNDDSLRFLFVNNSNSEVAKNNINITPTKTNHDTGKKKKKYITENKENELKKICSNLSNCKFSMLPNVNSIN